MVLEDSFGMYGRYVNIICVETLQNRYVHKKKHKFNPKFRMDLFSQLDIFVKKNQL